MNTHMDLGAVLCPWLILLCLYPHPTALLPNLEANENTVSFHPVSLANTQSVFTVLLTDFFNSVYFYHDLNKVHTLVNRSLKSFLMCPFFPLATYFLKKLGHLWSLLESGRSQLQDNI